MNFRFSSKDNVPPLRGAMAEIGKKYNENDVQEAIKAVKVVNEGMISLREVEQSFNVQKSTIHKKAKAD